MGRKETIWQNDFSLGAVRLEAVEMSDSDLVGKSVREALNTICLTTGQLQGRPGSVYEVETTSDRGWEVDLGGGRIYHLEINSDGLILEDEGGTAVYTVTGEPWTALDDVWGSFSFSDIQFWVVPDPDRSAILIGSNYFPIQAVALAADGTWSVGAMQFKQSIAGVSWQPYWPYHRGVKIAPSDTTGLVSVTADTAIFTTAHQGMKIRYAGRQLQLLTYVSSTVMTASCTEDLYPTMRFEVDSSDGFYLGDVVQEESEGGIGIVVGVPDATHVDVLSTEGAANKFSGGGRLLGPNVNVSSTSKAIIAPGETDYWDMQMQSRATGYAGWAARHKGRLYLCDFPGAPQAYAGSVAGDGINFLSGDADDDGFVDSLGNDRGGDLKYIISTEDMIFLTTRGLYYQRTSGGEAITPKTIAPVAFSKIGCAAVPPAAVDEGCVFVSAGGEQVYAAVLTGNVYRSWSAKPLAAIGDQTVINVPRLVEATASGTDRPEQFIWVVNADGTAAVCQWDRDAGSVSWRPWQTDGEFVSLYQCFGATKAVVDRTIDGDPVRCRERFDYDVHVDCAALIDVTAGVLADGADHLSGNTAALYFEGWIGEAEIDVDGAPLDEFGEDLTLPEWDGTLQVGFAFTKRVIPWARRSRYTQHGTREVKRTVGFYATVQGTSEFTIDGKAYGAYRFGEVLAEPPPLRSRQYKATFLGKAGFEEIAIEQTRPGPFLLLKLGYVVVI